jgi:hypothetical protein
MNSDPDLLKKTMKMVGMMLGALTLFMGTLTILVVVVVGQAVGPRSSSSSDDSKIVPASNVHGKPGDKPESDGPRPRPGSQVARATPAAPGAKPAREPPPGTNRAI